MKRSSTVTTNPGTVAAGRAPSPAPVHASTRRREIIMFLILAVVTWPFLAVAFVGGFGFLVWMSQLVLGPPGPPPV